MTPAADGSFDAKGVRVRRTSGGGAACARTTRSPGTIAGAAASGTATRAQRDHAAARARSAARARPSAGRRGARRGDDRRCRRAAPGARLYGTTSQRLARPAPRDRAARLLGRHEAHARALRGDRALRLADAHRHLRRAAPQPPDRGRRPRARRRALHLHVAHARSSAASSASTRRSARPARPAPSRRPSRVVGPPHRPHDAALPLGDRPLHRGAVAAGPADQAALY